jgi:hypothetical protein
MPMRKDARDFDWMKLAGVQEVFGGERFES